MRAHFFGQITRATFDYLYSGKSFDSLILRGVEISSWLNRIVTTVVDSNCSAMEYFFLIANQ